MPQLEVDKIIPQSGTTLTIGETGDTISFASGVLPSLESLTITGDLTVDTNTLYVDSTNNYVKIGSGDNRTGFLSQSDGNLQIKNGIIFESGDAAIDNEIFTYRSNDLLFGTSGSEKMRITSSGNVGIGTTSPSSTQRLTLKGDFSTIESGILFDVGGNQTVISHASATSPSFVISNKTASGVLRFDTDSTERMRITSSGNVGIGTSSPAVPLEVNGGLNCGFLQSTSSIYATSGIFRSSDGSASTPSIQPGVDNDTGFFRAATNTIGFSTAGTERMRLNSSGYLGINTTSPSSQLEVVGTVRVTNTATPANTSNIRDGGGLVIESGNSNPMYFYTGGSERMRITSTGRVGIGTTNPSQELQANGQIRYGFSVTIDGGTVASGSADDYKTSGFYRINQTVTNLPSAHIYAVIVFGNGSNVVTQIANRLASTITYVRSFNNSWTSWQRLDT